MRLIATTKIGNFPVRIYEGPEAQRDHDADGITEKTTDGREIRIILDPGMSEDVYWETFYHELIHAFERGFGYNLKHPLVSAMGMGLFQLLHEMKWEGTPAVGLPPGLQRAKKKHRRK